MESSSTPPPGPPGAIEIETDLGTMWADPKDEVLTPALLELGCWDLTIGRLIANVLGPGMTFVDAGANIGYFTVLGSRLVGPEGRVFAVEPDPANLRILEANVARHACPNVTILPVAAWHEAGRLSISRPEGHGAVARVGVPSGHGTVEAVRLDRLIEGRVDYLKVDCEFSDHLVVRGAEGLIDRNPELLVTVEFHPTETGQTGDSPSEILELYRAMGFKPYEISPTGAGLIRSSFRRIASPRLPEGYISFDFALARVVPDRLLVGRIRGGASLLDRELRGKSILERAGDVLERVPRSIRPPIRRRDRAPSEPG